MPPYWLPLILALVGSGVLKVLLDRGTSFGELLKWAICFLAIVILFTAQYQSIAYPKWPRHIRSWQRKAFIINCPEIPPLPGRIRFYIGSAPGQLEAEDYSRQIMDMFNACHLEGAYGYDPFPEYVVVNEQRVVLPPGANSLLRISGIQLWVLNPKAPPDSAKLIAKALTAAGILFHFEPDIRLAGVATYDTYRLSVNGPDCIIFVGVKPAWSLRAWWDIERAHLSFLLK
ncbi:MAG: hypothetical protein WAM05_16540 [Candidatus Binataceae bacterium]